MTDKSDRVLDAALNHVPFDGWSDDSLRAAARDVGLDVAHAKALFPRGGVDLALAYHRRGDGQMLARLAETDLQQLRFRDRIATAVRLRIEACEDRELVRRGTTLFALPLCRRRRARDMGHGRPDMDGPWRYIARCELVYQTRHPVGGVFGHSSVLAGR